MGRAQASGVLRTMRYRKGGEVGKKERKRLCLRERNRVCASVCARVCEGEREGGREGGREGRETEREPGCFFSALTRSNSRTSRCLFRRLHLPEPSTLKP
jgi:hypothetical protein